MADERTINVGRDSFERIDGQPLIVTGQNPIIQYDLQSKSSITEEERTRQATLLTAYFHWLVCDARQLSLTGIDRRVTNAEDSDCQNLDVIYTALLTLGAERLDEEFLDAQQSEQISVSLKREQRQLSALAQLNQHQHLVLLGDPGSGKSTFVNFVAMCLAGAAMGEEEDYFTLLTAPLPDNKGKDTDERQPWQHGALLPIRVILRDFAARGLPPEGEPVSPDHLWQFLAHELQAIDPALTELTPLLQDLFFKQGGLLLLDGLDEVPEAERYRQPIKAFVTQFTRVYHRCRVLVTSRTYAYQKQGWRLQHFAEAVLAPFSRGQICRFIDRWYPSVAASYDLSEKEARHRAIQLKDQILTRPALYALAGRPLLLTLMASLHAWKLRDLPKKRVELYKETVDLLLDRWERRKFTTKDANSPPKSLLEWLKTDKDAVLQKLSELAYQAHEAQTDTSNTTADVTESDIVTGLLAISNEEVRPKLLVKYLRDRTGLLIPHGIQVYTFPHRTFQEYLAACYLTSQDDYPDNIAELFQRDHNRWREVLLLAAARVSAAAPMIWALVEALCEQDITDTPITSSRVWGALLAGQALVESANLARISPRNQKKVDRIRDWLVAILTERVPPDAPFPAVERALAGNVVAQLGDPRPGVGLREDGLPDIAWCEVPAGEFLMGSELPEDNMLWSAKPQHCVRLSAYQISRYPVTNAQFQAFLDDDGYRKRAYWMEEGWEWKMHEDITDPRTFGGDFDLSNHPVVGVSWYEASAFCCWLTVQLRERGEFGEADRICLPTEAQWEKAARGPDARIYPWGNADISPELANYADTGLGVTSSVGCFPRGVSPYGCEEMAGNVDEWCHDWFSDDYYQESPGNDPQGPESGSARVDRGGRWGSGARLCRAASRGRWPPDYRFAALGFRLVRAGLRNT